MGAAMVRRLRVADVDLVVYNRTHETAAELAARSGATARTTARQAVNEADVCLVSLADDAAVRATYAGVDGLVAGLRPGVVVCETSTVSPATVRGLADAVTERGATLLDCPVSGSVPVVERGELTVMAGGDVLALDRARPVLDILATRVFHLGGLGSGATMKLAVNALVHALNVSLSEALVLAEKAGLDREKAYDVFEASAVGAPFVRYKRAAYLDPEGVPVAFSLELVAKDQGLIHDLAADVGARMDQAEANRVLVAAAVAAGLGQRDMSALAGFLR
jgi:3-hydroxyisobutyrate dehydrogenase-like beta-hydroxyacid dehydrogenase